MSDTVSRQRRWQKKKHREGKCVICGQHTGGSFFCGKHAEANRRRARERYRRKRGIPLDAPDQRNQRKDRKATPTLPLNADAELVRRLKDCAAERGVTARRLADEALERFLELEARDEA